MTSPEPLARHPAIDRAARAVLAALGTLDRAEALARLERIYSATLPGPRRRALLAARLALLRGAPLIFEPPAPEPAPVEPEALPAPEPEPLPEPQPPAKPAPKPAPKPVEIPKVDFAAMMSLFAEFDPKDEGQPAPEDLDEPADDPETDDAPEGERDEGWTRIRLTEDGPRGPGHFPKGGVLSVRLEDAARLLIAGIAEELDDPIPLPATEDDMDPEQTSPAEVPAAAGTPFKITFPEDPEDEGPKPFKVTFPDDPDEGPKPFKVTFPDDPEDDGPKPFKVTFPDDPDEAEPAPARKPTQRRARKKKASEAGE
ncbi:hypothetical protein SAMN05878503_101381 [Cereibacter ovatus]|uniref:Uncharacterized protein n=1 Tax=Cereibacter ovatus TaxID=439529 RepID=A0A285CL55_9RHOB|nr:hypothetical protein [Cereibacter ovatus]SNX67743.1 hypothetical protein SAMN05878503_101381 [Cereibacter ovatus]